MSEYLLWLSSVWFSYLSMKLIRHDQTVADSKNCEMNVFEFSNGSNVLNRTYLEKKIQETFDWSYVEQVLSVVISFLHLPKESCGYGSRLQIKRT